MVHLAPPADGVLISSILRSETLQHSTPIHKPSRSDVHFPLTTPRRTRAPSISSVTETMQQHSETDLGKLTVRVRAFMPEEQEMICQGNQDFCALSTPSLPSDSEMIESDSEMIESDTPLARRCLSFEDLPSEVQGLVLDYIFGDMRSIGACSTPLQPGSKNISSSLRHPRRKAVSDLALVSPEWRDLVQERIYRHIKIKGTRAGLQESSDWFSENMHLTRHIRHIEFWVPVWGDKASLDKTFDAAIPSPTGARGFHHLASGPDSHMSANELLGFNFKLSTYSSTLEEIFNHVNCFFPDARVFTLEGGHCKKSNMIRHFPGVLFPVLGRRLQVLPNITTFAMRGSWNIMRDYQDWTTIQNALPNVEEWHCAYAKPRPEAYNTISTILLNMPYKLRHVTICLDGFYSKDSTSPGGHNEKDHLCQRLGRIAPQLESLSYTGKVCSLFWTAACETVRTSRERPNLRALEMGVKKCCRTPVSMQNIETGQTIIAMLNDVTNGVLSDSAGINNMAFIRAFERLTVSTVKALGIFDLLKYVRIRFIDLDSPCALLNPYFQVSREKCFGLWNEEILDLLPRVRPALEYEELGEGIGIQSKDDLNLVAMYPRCKPKSIKSSSYKILADARGAF